VSRALAALYYCSRALIYREDATPSVCYIAYTCRRQSPSRRIEVPTTARTYISVLLYMQAYNIAASAAAADTRHDIIIVRLSRSLYADTIESRKLKVRTCSDRAPPPPPHTAIRILI